MKNKTIGAAIISSAIIWGAVMIGCAFILRGTGYYNNISFILYGGVIMHFIMVWPIITLISK